MKRAFLLFFLSCGYLTSAQVTLSSPMEFRPEVFYVGDRVQLVISLHNPFQESLFLPETYPRMDWVEIIDSSLLLEEGGSTATIVLTFIPFEPGTKTLQEINFGAFLLQDLKINTRSVLPLTGRELSTFQDPILLPRTEFVLVILLLSLFLIPLGLFYLGRFLITLTGLLIKRIQKGRPLKLFLRECEKLRTKIFGTTSSFFYSVLVDELKIYLDAGHGLRLQSATSSEILQALKPFFPKEDWDILGAFLGRTDEALFGSGEFAEEKRLYDLDLVTKVSQEMEEMKLNLEKTKEDASA